MKPAAWSTLALAALMLGACNQNTAIGNDREAALDPPSKPAAIEPAASALRNVATALVKPETMSEADLAAVGGTQGRCIHRLTEIGHPVFVYEAGGEGFVKLNGKLIPLTASGADRYASGALIVATRDLGSTGNAGLAAQEMIIVPPGAKDELGFHGYVSCPPDG